MKRNKTKLILALFIVMMHSFAVFAADHGSISGKVFDKVSGEALPGANVYIEGTAFGTATSLDGSYTLSKIPAGDYDLQIRYIGYTLKSIPMTIEAGETVIMNISAFLEGDFRRVSEDLQEVLALAKPCGVPFKVIIEVGALKDRQIIDAANLVADSGADFVKTSTGFGPGRATFHNISLIKETVGEAIGIKASGGVASLEDGVAFMRAGATVVALRRQLVEQLQELNWE